MSRLRPLLLGVTLALCLLIFAPQGASAATTISPPDATVAAGQAAAIDSAVEQYLSNLPGDFHAIRSVPALKRLLASGNVLLIDVRTPAEYRAGHIAGAINRPLNFLGHHVAEISPEREVVLYCSGGFRSAMGVMALQLEGRPQVKGFAPSIEGWKAAGEGLGAAPCSMAFAGDQELFAGTQQTASSQLLRFNVIVIKAAAAYEQKPLPLDHPARLP